MKLIYLFIIPIILLFTSCIETKEEFNPTKNLDYCSQQVTKSINQIEDATMMPRNILKDEKHWNLRKVTISEWTAGF